MTSSDEKLEVITEIIQRDIKAADLKISIFISAAVSFKRDSLLTPFPKTYLNSEGVKDFERLADDLSKIPNLEEFLVLVISGNTSFIKDNTIDLMHFILTTPKYNIKSVHRNEFDKILALSNKTGKISNRPKQIFSLDYRDSNAERRFKQLSLGIDSGFAFHGTKFFNIYSILSFGLQQHLNKTGLFGEGLYFSKELDVSLLFSPSVLGWNQSALGDTLSVVALCEYIDDPNYVKVRKENAKNSDIPHSYLLITNNEVVRVRYLLMYGSKKSAPAKKATTEAETEVAAGSSGLSVLKWCRKNPMIVSVILYVLILFLVGCSNNRAVEYYKNNLMNFLKNRFKFL